MEHGIHEMEGLIIGILFAGLFIYGCMTGFSDGRDNK